MTIPKIMEINEEIIIISNEKIEKSSLDLRQHLMQHWLHSLLLVRSSKHRLTNQLQRRFNRGKGRSLKRRQRFLRSKTSWTRVDGRQGTPVQLPRLMLSQLHLQLKQRNQQQPTQWRNTSVQTLARWKKLTTWPRVWMNLRASRNKTNFRIKTSLFKFRPPTWKFPEQKHQN